MARRAGGCLLVLCILHLQPYKTWMWRKVGCRVHLPFAFCRSDQGVPPPGYYDSAQGRLGVELRRALHSIIDGHRVVPYSSSTALDTSDALKVLDEDADDTNSVRLIYSVDFDSKTNFGLTTGWNREHL